MIPEFAKKSDTAIPMHIVEADKLMSISAKLNIEEWVKANQFDASLGQILIIPDNNGSIASVLVGWGTKSKRSRGRFHMGAIALKLPKGTYEILSGLSGKDLENAHLAWILSTYCFDRYKKKSVLSAKLKASKEINTTRILIEAEGDFITRDLVNTPTNDMGPDALEKAFCNLALKHNAYTQVIKGGDLLKQNFPMIHAVGRASDQEPRLLDMKWGDKNNPKVTLVGKGVCFDTGGLNIKPTSSMGLMKKDMGGAATVLGLAHMIMSLNLNVNLRVIIPAVENSISSNSFRPQDILISRKGMSVEINHTDAEGRLVLADALCLADEDYPDLLICNATLTGAARVALGPDMPPFFTDDEELAIQIQKASLEKNDPLWRLPFWNPYEDLIEPDVADLDNAPKGGFAGAITAALFLRRFVDKSKYFVHFDLFAWSQVSKPSQSKGGACQSARAMLSVIEKRYE
ncbi:leucyl aminopeptidase family protein [Amylibacter sp.]|nr:leucyl aminopeptidase family protein [bacterium]MDB4145086.1 leucyl aminopeptidase family protein [Amylibacter sp.]MDC1414337.1 leucyl aminopeptidase family protein [Amylibacter sp.]